MIDRLERERIGEHASVKMEEASVGIVGANDCVGEPSPETFPIIREVGSASTALKLVSRDLHPQDTLVRIGDTLVGGGTPVIIAGPCSVESRQQIIETANAVRKAGAQLLRGGAYKPRTSPYSFQGLGEEGLKYLAMAREDTGLPIVTEIMDHNLLPMMESYVDVLQIGARNMQNYTLLKAVARSNKPVLLKRGPSATIEEWLMAAEYILAGGNPNVILCERGIRTFETYTRNTLDLNAVPVVQYLSHLPIIVDPSHGVGNWRYVTAMARAGIAAGASGLIVEVHQNPTVAMSDGEQSLTIENFEHLVREVRRISVSLEPETVEA